MAQGSSTQRVDVLRINGTTADTNSGNKSAGTLRVVLATDQPNLTSALNVSAAVTSLIPGVAATSLGKAEDAVHADGDTGVMMLAVRKDTAAALAGTTGDYIPLTTNATGYLWVDASGQTLTVNTHAVTVASGGIASGAIASGAIASGAVASGAFASGSISSGAIAAGAIAAGATSIAENEDVASADGDRGVKVLAVRKGTPANTSGTDGDYEFFQISAGRLWTSANIDQINGVTPLMGAGNTGTGSMRVTVATDNAAIATWGHGATAASVPANVSYAGRRGTTALPTAVTDGQSVGSMADKFGRTVSLVGTIRDLTGTQTTTISASTSETTIVTAGAAGVFNDLVMLIISNTSASTNTRIDFRDATAGSVLFSLQSNGGQPPVGFALAIPIPQTTAANNWTAQCSASTTDIRIYAVYAKNK